MGCIKIIFLQIEATPRDPEFYGLLYNVQSENIPGHLFRGYSVLGENNNREVAVNSMKICELDTMNFNKIYP